ncbi:MULTISPECIES: lipopolysaccharide biosynthesis protein [unclassified Curtobacterium]|uniref:lipopolysaccharide biosynthesis protein n=1 Tax=unclassified Curtobacterium TaxID=257496 RepID=UPI000DA6EEC1|nr:MULTISPECIES: oligosaccharide flippase family protein [unclassified Curtobacterium]PZE27900.1 hypothetical protein DEI86_04705 [Curtobacterium sp. MCBD17_028]PZF62492.1 hypothetical protein DEI92_03155 [Curtobacterium sp. MCBD17_034]PZM39800.1 hypothetical protein DEI90_02950 [Curtobacterium sp. MCBD17_031]
MAQGPLSYSNDTVSVTHEFVILAHRRCILQEVLVSARRERSTTSGSPMGASRLYSIVRDARQLELKALAQSPVVWTTGITYLGMGLSVLSAPALAHALGATGRGELAATFVVVQLLAWMAFLGVPRGAAVEEKAQLVTPRRSYLVMTVLGVAATAMGYFSAPVLYGDTPVVEVYVRIASLTLLATGFAQFGGERLLLEQRMWSWNAIRAATLVLPSLLIVVLYVIGHLTLANAFLATLSGQAIATLLGAAFAFPTRRRAGVSRRLPWKFSTHYWLASAFDSLGARFDQLALGAFVAPAHLGIYAVAVTCSSASGALTQALNNAGFATFFGEEGRGNLRTRALMGFASSVASGVLIVAVTVLFWRALFGAGYEELPAVTAILVVFQLLNDQWQLRVFFDSAAQNGVRLVVASAIAFVVMLAGILILHGTGHLDELSMACVMAVMAGVRLSARSSGIGRAAAAGRGRA